MNPVAISYEEFCMLLGQQVVANYVVGRQLEAQTAQVEAMRAAQQEAVKEPAE